MIRSKWFTGLFTLALISTGSSLYAQEPGSSLVRQDAVSTSPVADQVITRHTFRNVAKKVSPSVVNIKIKSNIVFGGRGGAGGRIQIPPSFGFDDQMREYLEKLFEREMPNWSPGEQEDYKYSRSGSGVIVRPDGYLVTSNHVVSGQNANDIEVSVPDGRTFKKIKIVGLDELTDLAVLKIDEPVTLPALTWGDTEKVEVGDFVVAIGNPLEFNNSVSEGIVSAKHRTIKKAPIEDLLQTTAMINPGNSGGALVNLDGELVGINMAIATSTGMWSGLGFAIPSHTAKDVTDQIIDRGKVARGYLGIDMAQLTGNLAQQLGYGQNFGIVVKGVRPGSAAERAGLQRYDIIAKVGEKEIREINDMHRNIGGRRSGEKVELEVWRDEGKDKVEQKKIVVTLDERPSQNEIEKMMRGGPANEPKLPGKMADDDLLGLEVEENPDGRGALVTDVQSGSRAFIAGVQKGDVIIEINRQAVKNEQDAQKAMQDRARSNHLFFIEREGSTLFITIEEQ